jgi:hypothetical protein
VTADHRPLVEDPAAPTAGGRATSRRRVLLGAGAAGLAASLSPRAAANDKPDTADLEIEPIDVNARPIETFSRGSSSATRFGELEFVGGVVLSSPAASFGGWSGIEVDADGRRVVMVSDAGTWLTGELAYSGGRIRGLEGARTGPLLARSASSLKRERDRDAEAVRLIDGTLTRGRLLISFERNHRIGLFETDGRSLTPPTGYMPMPPEARRMRSNKGFEAVAVIRGGAGKGGIVAFAELLIDAQGHHSAWLWPAGGAAARRLTLKDIGNYEITDAVGLDDGSLILLERRFRWTEGMHLRLRHIPAQLLRPGVVMDGEVLLEASLAHEIDNMEGLAVHRGPRGETILSIVSDDNFNGFLQRTEILQFAWTGAASAARGAVRRS